MRSCLMVAKQMHALAFCTRPWLEYEEGLAAWNLIIFRWSQGSNRVVLQRMVA